MIGIWLQADARGHGLGTQAQRLVVDLLFRHTTTNRVEAHTDVENAAERRSLEKVGMRAEGITRGAQWRDGAYRDGHLYAVLRGEWTPLDATH
jgi:RimJ/RimL family protein N-acetyltransferase